MTIMIVNLVLEVEYGAAWLVSWHVLLEFFEGSITITTHEHFEELGIFAIEVVDNVAPLMLASQVVILIATSLRNIQVTHLVHELFLRPHESLHFDVFSGWRFRGVKLD